MCAVRCAPAVGRQASPSRSCGLDNQVFARLLRLAPVRAIDSGTDEVSRYEVIRKELATLNSRRACVLLAPAIGVAWLFVPSVETLGTKWLVALLIFGCVPILMHAILSRTVPPYRRWSVRSSLVRAEIADLRSVVTAIFAKYRGRVKGEHFKRAYDLRGRSVRDLEEALSVGMFRERREVFVTAFMRRGVSVRVTASIGSPFHCAAADDPRLWANHIDAHCCDEVRQYHNHPDHNGRTAPSTTDIRSSGRLRALLGSHGPKLCSLIICWNDLREWKVYEYDESGRHALQFEFDAATAPPGDRMEA